jgi:hypothetical protein
MIPEDAFRPPSDQEVPPWQLEGNFRLDCDPHHGFLLRWMANSAFLCTLAAWGCFLAAPLFACCGQFAYAAASFGLLGCVGGSLGLAAWLLARRDLVQIRAGNMDPDGQWEVQFALARGYGSFLLGLLPTVVCVLVVLPVW